MSNQPKDSVIVKALADIASQGTYQVKPEGARTMNEVFSLVADLINRLEAQEAETENFFNEELNQMAAQAAEEEQGKVLWTEKDVDDFKESMNELD